MTFVKIPVGLFSHGIETVKALDIRFVVLFKGDGMLASSTYVQSRPFGRGFLGNFKHVATDAKVLSQRDLFLRGVARRVEEEKRRRTEQKEKEVAVQNELKRIMKTAKFESEIPDPAMQKSSSEESSVKGVGVVENTAHGGFQDTIPVHLVIENTPTKAPPCAGGGGGNKKPPEHPKKGDDFAKSQGSLPYLVWKVILICLLIGYLVSTLYGLDKVKNMTDIALLKIAELAKDMEYGSKLVATLSGRVLKNESDIHNHTESIEYLRDGVTKTGKSIHEMQGRLRVVESSVIDPDVISRNAENVAKLQGDVNAIKRNTARVNTATAANTKAVDELKKANTENVAAIEMLKDAVASLKPKDESLLPGAKGGTVPQKGGYRLSSMTYMDGGHSKLYIADSGKEKMFPGEQLGAVYVKYDSPYTGKLISFKLDPDYDK